METVNLRNIVLEQVQKADDRLLKLLNALARSYQEDVEGDWWIDLPSEEKEEIITGLRQANNNEFIEHEAVMQRLKK